MARMTKKQIEQQHKLLEYVVTSAADRCRKFRKWSDEAHAKAYDLAEAVRAAEDQLDAANLDLYKFCKAHKIKEGG